jgi:PII-like signaling protein
MTDKFRGERTLMRVFIGESDRCDQGAHKGRPLYEALLLFFRERGLADANGLGLVVDVLASVAGVGLGLWVTNRAHKASSPG